EETAEYAKMLPTEKAYQVGNNNTAIMQVREKIRGDLEAKLNSYFEEGAGTTVAPRSAALADATFHGEAAPSGFVEKEGGRVVARDSEDSQTKNFSGAWADFKGYDVDKLKSVASGKEGSEAAQHYAQEELSAGQPEYAVAIDHLAVAYARPHGIYRNAGKFGVDVGRGRRNSRGELELVGGAAETPATLRRDAPQALRQIALGEYQGKRIPAGAMEYAQYVLSQIENDPVLSAVQGTEDVMESPFIERLGWRPGL